MQAIIIGAIIAAAAGFLARSISKAWIRFCIISAFAILPILLAVVVLSLAECDNRLPNGMCNDAGLTIMSVIAVLANGLGHRLVAEAPSKANLSRTNLSTPPRQGARAANLRHGLRMCFDDGWFTDFIRLII